MPEVFDRALAGLSSDEAQRRLDRDGPNELPRTGRRSVFRIALEVLREPMLALLLAGGVAYMLLGDLSEALILLAFATFSVLVTVVQIAGNRFAECILRIIEPVFRCPQSIFTC